MMALTPSYDNIGFSAPMPKSLWYPVRFRCIHGALLQAFEVEVSSMPVIILLLETVSETDHHSHPLAIARHAAADVRLL